MASIFGFVILQLGNWVFDKFADILSRLINITMSLIGVLYEQLNKLLTSTPYPQQEGSTAPKLLGEPAQDNWAAIYALYTEHVQETAFTLIFIALSVHAILRVGEPFFDNYNPTSSIRTCIKAIFVTLFWWPVGVVLLIASDILADIFINIGTGDSTGLQGLLRIMRDNIAGMTGSDGAGTIASLLLIVIPLALKATIVFGFLLLWQIRDILIYLLMPTYPIVYTFKVFDFPYFSMIPKISGFSTKAFVNLVFLTVPAGALTAFFGIAMDAAGGLVNAKEVSEGSSNMAVLADGAVATQATADLHMQILGILLIVILGITFPLVIAGGPWALFYVSSGGSSVTKGMMNPTSIAGQLPGANKAQSAGGAAKSVGKGVASGYKGRRGSSEESSSPDGREGTIPSGSGSSASGGEASSEEADSGEAGRVSRLRSKASSAHQTAKDIHDQSASERIGSIAARGASASESAAERARNADMKGKAGRAKDLMKQKAASGTRKGIKSGVFAARNPVKTSYAAKQSAKNLAKKGVSKTKQKQKDWDDSLDDTLSHMDDKISSTASEYRKKSAEGIRAKIDTAKSGKEWMEQVNREAKNADAKHVADRFEVGTTDTGIGARRDETEEEMMNKVDSVSETYDRIEESLIEKHGKSTVEDELGVDLSNNSLAELRAKGEVEEDDIKSLFGDTDVVETEEAELNRNKREGMDQIFGDESSGAPLEHTLDYMNSQDLREVSQQLLDASEEELEKLPQDEILAQLDTHGFSEEEVIAAHQSATDTLSQAESELEETADLFKEVQKMEDVYDADEMVDYFEGAIEGTTMSEEELKEIDNKAETAEEVRDQMLSSIHDTITRNPEGSSESPVSEEVVDREKSEEKVKQ